MEYRVIDAKMVTSFNHRICGSNTSNRSFVRPAQSSLTYGDSEIFASKGTTPLTWGEARSG